MKKIIILLILNLFFLNSKAQTTVNIDAYGIGDNSNKYFKDIENNFQNFTGIWENTTGIITFRLTMWKVENDPLTSISNSFMDRIYGKYLIVQNAGMPNEIILFESIKYFPQSNYVTNWVLLGKATSSIFASGSFIDTNANNGTNVIDGTFSFEILNIGNTPLQAQWKIKSLGPLFTGEFFTVPTDCILTKVN